MRDVVAEVFTEYPVAFCAELVGRTGEFFDQHFIDHVLRLGLGAGEDIESDHHPMRARRLRRIPQRRDRDVGHDERLHSHSDRQDTPLHPIAQVSQVVLFQRYAQNRVKGEASRQ